jgi:asparagine synthase (glutamine-hydrolysing)
MCGITGFFISNKSIDRNKLIKNLNEMTSALDHRGPDGKNIWINKQNTLGFGHTRLSIRDLSINGNQPMISENKRYIIVYNGELYFTQKLKAEIIKNKIVLKSSGDTEILLEYFSLFGLEKTLNDINGIFAFAIYDLLKKKLIIARDRFGVKPLYWGKINNSFIFSSELKSIKRFFNFNNTLDVKSINYFIAYGHIPSPFSIYKYVKKLEPGNFIEVDQDLNIKKIKYYNSNKLCFSQKNKFSFEENCQILDGKISEIVKEQMVSDVSVGSYLSSGIDSSLITAIMASNSKKKINTYTVGFENEKFDESAKAEKIANSLHTNHTTIKLNDNDIINYFEKISYYYDEPFADSSQLPTLLISELSKKKTKVILSGDGGDEIFGGYNRYNDCVKKLYPSISIFTKEYLKNMIVECLVPFPDKFQNIIGSLFYKKNLSEKIRLYKKYNSEHDINKIYYYIMCTIPKDDGIMNEAYYYDEIHNYNADNLCLSDYEKLMLTDLNNYLPNDILTKVDRGSMAFSQEVRVPFLDHNLVEFAWTIPVEFKIKNENNKFILKKILEKRIPHTLLSKEKKGFGIPIDEIFRNEIFKSNKFFLEKDMIKKNKFLNSDKVNEIYLKHKKGENNNGNKLWNILILQKWLFDNEYIN